MKAQQSREHREQNTYLHDVDFVHLRQVLQLVRHLCAQNTSISKQAWQHASITAWQQAANTAEWQVNDVEAGATLTNRTRDSEAGADSGARSSIQRRTAKMSGPGQGQTRSHCKEHDEAGRPGSKSTHQDADLSGERLADALREQVLPHVRIHRAARQAHSVSASRENSRRHPSIARSAMHASTVCMMPGTKTNVQPSPRIERKSRNPMPRHEQDEQQQRT